MLLWRCRRGMREMDILLQGYLKIYYDDAPKEEQKKFSMLLDENDLDILSWITREVSADQKYADIIRTIQKLADNTNHLQMQDLV